MSLLHYLPIVSIILFIPLLGGLVLLFIPKDRYRLLQAVAVLTALLPLLLSLWLYGGYSVQQDSSLYGEKLVWMNAELFEGTDAAQEDSSIVLRASYETGIDGLSLPLVVTASLVTVMAALASVYIKKRRKAYYGWLLLLEFGITGVFLARDLLLLFAFMQVVLVAVAFLIGIWGGEGKEKAARQWLLVNGFSSAFALIAILLLIHAAGGEAAGSQQIYSSSYDILNELTNSEWQTAAVSGEQPPLPVNEAFRWMIFLLFLGAFSIRFAVFPFHFWLLKSVSEAPAPVAMMISGGILPIGAYGLIRFCFALFPLQANAAGLVMAVFGLLNLIYAAVLACRQTGLRLVLAYAMVSQSGLTLLGIAAANQTGTAGAVLHVISYSIAASLLWLLAGTIQERTGSDQFADLGGLAKPMPFVGGVFAAAALALLGMPGLSGFTGLLFTVIGLYDVMPALAYAAAFGLLLTAVYTVRCLVQVMYGTVSERWLTLRDARLAEAVPMIVLLAFTVLIGCYPAVVTDTLIAGISEWYGALFGTGVIG